MRRKILNLGTDTEFLIYKEFGVCPRNFNVAAEASSERRDAAFVAQKPV
jgi:hypothetical protein